MIKLIVKSIILLFHILYCTCNQYSIQSLFRSLTLPISLAHGVPYLQFKQLCSASLYQQLTNFNQILWDQEHYSQFQELNNYHQQSALNVLIDTGSSQFWLADSGCHQCSYTKPLCPHLTNSQRKVNYMKGFIQGVDSYLNICGNRIKYLCVKAAQGLSQLKGEGILGFRDNSTGLNFLKKMIQLKSKENNKVNKHQNNGNNRNNGNNNRNEQNLIVMERLEIAFDYGSVFNNLVVKQIKNIFRSSTQLQNYQIFRQSTGKNTIILKTGRSWQFFIDKILLFNGQICLQCDKKTKPLIKAYIDTGSSKIVLSANLCLSLLTQMQEKLNVYCKYVENEGIDCDRIIKNLQLQLIVNGVDHQFDEMILEIVSSFIIDASSNRINIICLPQSPYPSEQKIILGYSFLRSYFTAFSVQSIKTKQSQSQNLKQLTENRVYLKNYSTNNDYFQFRILKIMMIAYIIVVILISWCAVYFLDFFRDKRSKKIII